MARAAGDSRRRMRTLLAVAALATAVRVAYLATAADDPSLSHPILDCAIYDALARDLARGDNPWHEPYTVPPLYPYLLAGIHALSGGSILAARLFQALLGGVACVVTCLLGWRLFDRKVGVAAGVITALYGPLVFYDVRLLTSVLVVLLHLLALLATVRAVDRPGWHRWLLCGLAVGVAALARPTTWPFFLLVVVAWILVSTARRRRWGPGLAALACLILGTLLPIAPVTARNHAVSGEFVPISTLGGMNLYIGNNPDAADTIAIRPGAAWRDLARQPHAEGVVTRAGADRYYLRQVQAFIRQQPGAFLAGLARKARLFFNAREVPRVLDPHVHREFSGVLRVLLWRVGPFEFPFGVLLPLGVLGFAVCLKGPPGRAVLLAYVAAVALSVIAFFNASRYRLPIVPVLALFAAAGVCWLAQCVSQRRWRQVGFGGLLVLIVGLAANSPVTAPSDAVDFRAEFHLDLGRRLLLEGDLAGAERAGRAALTVAPESVAAYQLASHIALRSGHNADARRHAEKAVELAPQRSTGYRVLAAAHEAAGSVQAALDALRQAVAVDPSDPDAHGHLAKALAGRGDYRAAIGHYREALRYQTDPSAYHQDVLALTGLLVREKRYAEAIALLARPDRRNDQPGIIDELAWLLATVPEDDLRDGQRAVALAEDLVRRSGQSNPVYLDTLAAAYACAGRFADATRTARRAAALARSQGHRGYGAHIDARGARYRQEEPCRRPQR